MEPKTRTLLTKLVEGLKTLSEDRFDAGSWASHGDLQKCGTSACAAGWATLFVPETNLVLEVMGSDRQIVHEPTRARSFEACQVAFGLPSPHEYFLFSSKEATLAEVIARIEGYLERDGALPDGWNL